MQTLTDVCRDILLGPHSQKVEPKPKATYPFRYIEQRAPLIDTICDPDMVGAKFARMDGNKLYLSPAMVQLLQSDYGEMRRALQYEEVE